MGGMPRALIGSSEEISELPQARSAEDPAKKFAPMDPLPQARSAEDSAKKFTPEDPFNSRREMPSYVLPSDC